MKLIIKSEFDNLKDNNEHGYDVDRNGYKEILKIYKGEELIAKRIFLKNKKKNAKRYFGCKNYKIYLKD